MRSVVRWKSPSSSTQAIVRRTVSAKRLRAGTSVRATLSAASMLSVANAAAMAAAKYISP